MQVEKECQSQIKSIRNRSVSYHQIWQRWLPPCSIAILFIITTLLCWWLLHAARISNGSLHRLARKRWVVGVLLHNIKSHHILIEQNITLVKSRQWETWQCNHQIFSTSHKSKKNICLISHIQSRQQSRQMWCTVGARSAGTSTQRNTLNSAGWSSPIFACLVVLDDWLFRDFDKRVL